MGWPGKRGVYIYRLQILLLFFLLLLSPYHLSLPLLLLLPRLPLSPPVPRAAMLETQHLVSVQYFIAAMYSSTCAYYVLVFHEFCLNPLISLSKMQTRKTGNILLLQAEVIVRLMLEERNVNSHVHIRSMWSQAHTVSSAVGAKVSFTLYDGAGGTLELKILLSLVCCKLTGGSDEESRMWANTLAKKLPFLTFLSLNKEIWLGR